LNQIHQVFLTNFCLYFGTEGLKIYIFDAPVMKIYGSVTGRITFCGYIYVLGLLSLSHI
jgi:hypothetical protein